MTVTVHHGDMLDVLARLKTEGATVHAIVTDPPYHLTSINRRYSSAESMQTNHPIYKRHARGFMGKGWDGGDIAFQPETWRRCWDLLPPGGYLLAFSGTRTYHRMVCAIEDAGFEIRDTIAWLYGSGFPKSHNVSKGIDGKLTVGGSNSAALRKVNETRPGPATVRAKNQRNGFVGNGDVGPSVKRSTPATPEAAEWEGWGTALKPALEPICVARKPLAGTVAANVLAHRTGALNIDGCRIGTEGGSEIPSGMDRFNAANAEHGYRPGTYQKGQPEAPPPQGRWPANVAHDGSEEVTRAFPDTGISTGGKGSRSGLIDGAVYGNYSGKNVGANAGGLGDVGSAARFFYSAKADADDRLGSKHPTVKPVDLMRWLVRLVTPPGGTVLDPFAGSGTTGMACLAEGFDAILVEREAEYVADIRRRIEHVHGADTPLFRAPKAPPG